MDSIVISSIIAAVDSVLVAALAIVGTKIVRSMDRQTKQNSEVGAKRRELGKLWNDHDTLMFDFLISLGESFVRGNDKNTVKEKTASAKEIREKTKKRSHELYQEIDDIYKRGES